MVKHKETTPWMWYTMMVLYLLYYGQSTFFPSLAFAGQLLIFAILFIGLINLIRSLKNPFALPACEYWVIAMLVILTISYIISPKIVSSGLLPNAPTLSQFKGMVAYFLPLFTGYQIGLRQRLSPKDWTIVSLILLAIAVNSYIEVMTYALVEYNQEESTNNSAYIFLYILPFIPLLVKKYKQTALLLLSVCFIFVMMGAKRGAIICMIVMFLYLMWWYLRRTRISFGTIAIIILILGVLIVGLNYFFTQDAYLQMRLEQTLEGNSSNRDVLYAYLWDAWVNADFFTQLFGRGISQTITIVGNYAHNDWLELLTDVGLIGALTYLMTMVSLLMFSKKFPKNSPERTAFITAIIFWFLASIFSMGMGITGGISMMLLGTLIGNKVNSRRKNAIRQENISNNNNEINTR